MATKKVTQEMRDRLRVPLPKEAIKPHPTKTFLSSIKTIFAVERLNDVFGVGSWQQKSKIISVSDNGMVVVYSQLFIPEYGIELESFGGNDNGGEKSKNFDLGDAYKGACTDALSKMCSYLEIAIDVYKGNPNAAPPAPPASTNTTQTASKTSQPKLTPANTAVWTKVLDGMKNMGRTQSDWPGIKSNYDITPPDEKKLFSEMGWN
jgi:hypothetical protein